MVNVQLCDNADAENKLGNDEHKKDIEVRIKGENNIIT